MAVATWSSSAALVKAVVLPLILVLLAMSTGASNTENGPEVAKSGVRFSETPVGRKLLALNFCGTGSAPNYNCPTLLGIFAKNATCCTNVFGTQACWDVGASNVHKCGSCTTKCKFGEVCCTGVCANLLTDKNNCGYCGRKCDGRCTLGFCNY